MAALDLGMFTNGATDPEGTNFEVRAALNTSTANFRKNRLYPGLAELVEIATTLEAILNNRNMYTSRLPRKLTGVDLEKKTLTFESVPASPEMVEQLFLLIEQLLPLIKTATDEGIAMFDFIIQNLTADIVGILPVYRDEGYALIPDQRSNLIHVLRYEMSLYTSEGDNYRALKTYELEPREMVVGKDAPEDIKLALVNEHREMPNPATYYLATDLDFPFEETILPIAKRKLMRLLVS